MAESLEDVEERRIVDRSTELVEFGVMAPVRKAFRVADGDEFTETTERRG